ncbi:histidine-type phosphatase [Caulobacter sp. KR2-114]|uniref:histidine-type phosphatase n=1 Tax=Caulobacter sp. KR2-114 TaxID=3400912 RepID=UPI003C06DB6D
MKGLLLLAAMAWAAAVSPALAAPVLERVVLVQRHGVRPPTAPNDKLNTLSAEAWPAWPVAPGELTPRGFEQVRLVAASIRQHYALAGLLPAKGCAPAGSIAVWADAGDQRTRLSGMALADGLAPGCGVGTPYRNLPGPDPIFDGVEDADCVTDPAAAQAAVAALAGPGGLQTDETRAAMKRLQAVVAPAGCDGGPGVCLAGDDTLAAGRYGAGWNGPMATGATLAENLLLEYAQGLTGRDLGWGRIVTADDIAAVMPAHERTARLLRRDVYLAGRRGAPMARAMLQAMQGEPTAGDAGPKSGPDVKLVALAGHDTNLSMIGGLFDVDWSLPGQPDATAPATALAFEVWRDGERRYVRPVVFYFTLDQLRSLSPDAANAMPLKVDGCADGPEGLCALEQVKQRVEARLVPGCLPKS